MSAKLENEKTLILKELQKYKSDTRCMKPLFESMKEISAWLSEKEK